MYDSNNTHERYKQVIRDLKDIEEIQTIIDKSNIEYLNKDIQIADLSSLFKDHKDFRHYNKNFTRYILMRTELVLKTYIGTLSRIKDFQEFCDFARKKGNAGNSIHIEHIYAWNDDNLALFENNAAKFDSERNKLGMVLLLGSQNLSSGNESYQKN